MPEHIFEILVVDDEPPICDLLIRTARQLFPEATFINTRSAQETLELIDQRLGKWPQLILLDIDLHQAVDGLDLLPLLASRLKEQVPIVMLTTSTKRQDQQKAMDRGATAYSLKPDNLQEWKAYVSALRTNWYKVS